MKNAILAIILVSLVVAACGNKVSGSYSLDIDATKGMPEFVAKNNETRGGAAMGLQVISQLAKNILIRESKFHLVSFDCEIDSSLTKAECIDQNDLKSPKKILSFSLTGEILKIDAGDGYPLVYTKLKS